MNMFSKITCTGREIFFCDLKNKNLLEIVKKYISLEKNEFIDYYCNIYLKFNFVGGCRPPTTPCYQ